MSDTGNGGGRSGGGARGGPGGKRPGGGAGGPGKGPPVGRGFRPGGGKPGASAGGESKRSFGAGRPSGDRPERSERPAGSRDGRPVKRFGDTPRADGDAPRKPFRPRTPREGGEARPERDDRRPGGDAPRSPRAADAPAGERAGREPFKPKSRAMFSHGGREADGSAKPPKSYGRLSHEGEGGSRSPRPPREAGERPKPAFDRPRRETPGAGAPSFGADRDEVRATGKMRIAKRLARAGIASRRDAEGMIADGRVKLNGKILDTPAIEVSGNDRIEIDGQPIPAIERTRLWLFNKPAGCVTTNRDPEGRPTVFDKLPEEMPRVLSIGRLDINTEGLLLLTNDGGLARLLELPSTGWLRRYRVRAHGEVTQAQLDELRQGIAVDGVFYGAIEASLDREQGTNVWLTLGLREGKNREVKRVLGHLGLEVNRLIRISFGPFQLGELGDGEVQEVKGKRLREQLGERLIEEAGADFDAPIVNVFSNAPVKAEPRADEREVARSKPGGEWISASDGGASPNRKKFGAAKREDALGRLDTKAPRRDRPERGGRPERGDKPFGERKPKSFGDRRDAPGEAPKPPRRPADAPKRTANVWMAPGARATGEKRKAEREERATKRREMDERPRRPAGDAPRPPRGDRPDRPPRGDAPRPPRGDRPSGPPRGDRPDRPSRPSGPPRGPRR